ncbi:MULTISPECIES: bifunctional hydroxymethylpyrimidine kinase/phosphomethylpyrimidine kinase [unclassified Nosocomiicoccus]|uniref:bifunctional hydroxymethylpyrimidine kinase/phosphomethylpyrimidine kinase n=1 Tax=unclassified Nosocomiicoccus TaxID=2646683 RepID=UPI0008A3BF70|nr:MULTISPECIES: bifunctional hydroxymethylpyrimidine kinase/phosphomethylpyrimidine kinase [unclassified Nosocomiicoccus]OFL48490.1 hydroxymethylpyrimidine/phosphomethylpyrimidine kinase [Nosocomiicoccus sp. HMSC067E10]OFO54378.1 hydroxymethylpyrimidine/phosphomethylpyrimidine kinase [Nosocomiicoccus sp. HMSC059G07]
MTLPIVLTVSSYDPTGGSGVNADLKAFQNLGVYGMSAITSLTAQNSSGIKDVLEIPDDFLEEQLKSIFDDTIPFAMKSGMITSIPMIEMLTKYVKQYHIPFVVDPYIFTREGQRIISEETTSVLKQQLLHHAAVVTPNINEAKSLTGIDIETEKDIETAAKIFLREIGVKAVIINDSNMTGEACDYLYTKTTSLKLTEAIVQTKNKRGSGSTFSAVITAEIAKGNSLEDAFRKAKRYVTAGLKNSLDIGKKNGPLNHFIDITSFV